MAENENSMGGGLPPKINLKKSGVLKPEQAAPPPEKVPDIAPRPDLERTQIDPAPPAPRPISAKPMAAGVRPIARPKTITVTPISKIMSTRPSVPDRPHVTTVGAGETEAKTVPNADASTPGASPRPIAAVRPMTKPVEPPAASEAKANSPAPQYPSVRIAAKRETTKISLDAARPKDMPTQKTLKAVKLVSRSEEKPLDSAVDSASTPEDPSKQVSVVASKRTTSRVSLEAVLGSATAGEDDGKPKTIRLKRPGAATSAKVSAVTALHKKPVVPGAGVTGEDAQEDRDADAAQTQRKTVVVKRSGAGRARKKVSVARAEGSVEASSAAGAPGNKAKIGPSEPGWVFAVYAVAAALITCVLIYVITAQVVGPNASLTEYSYSKTGPELPWPGKLSGAARPMGY
ncbi:MAG: hypothetical protein O3C57_00470 [Verrucomicrobia bacterium]|nr:hypothetical protein [Verrucomicrobiota bacterium]